ncbi:DUF551 domain-containing protein [Microvirga mediterraneensis]|uniref:DUF551 domain-containing protein n=1 Tax=Microvirga mediterraneensis TaxID=2754695 RepID=A0A838BTP7_9HYPH|nr:DUF551 domain-containing protein [Microvirga mediterraneensis]MBA1156891.1 DUF551 domain-containing protein [Microvirga mediterraneensis]MBA1157806.1 DUF551 domain-containing protein [Microvirga mediterraneensis]
MAGKMTDWIDVNDRLPGEQGQDSEDVLCFLNGHCGILDTEARMGGGWGIRLGFYDAGKRMFRCSGQPTWEVTHWMPLPEPPSLTRPTIKNETRHD